MRFDNEVAKHRKKKESSISKSNVKSKHKHNYIDCLLIIGEQKYPHKATYCNVCGKINDLHFWEVERTNNGFYRHLDTDEVYEKYKDLERIYINDIWQKYVPILAGEGRDDESKTEKETD